MGDGEGSSFDDIRVAKQHLFDLGWRDLLSSALDEILDSANNEEIDIMVEISEVAGSEPAVPKRILCSCRIVVVAPGDSGTPERDFSTLAGAKLSAFSVHDRYLGPGGSADRTRLASCQRICSNLRRALGHAVGFDHGHPEPSFQLTEHVHRQGCRGRTNDAQGTF